MPGKKKKAKSAVAQATSAKKSLKKVSRKILPVLAKDRHAKKLERRKLSHKLMHSKEWAEPPPGHLVGKLAVPKISTKHATYFEFADNHEKKKKLEYQVTNDHNPPPGFAFVPIGDPTVTDMCKEFSRERDAMIFIVSDQKEENLRISQHIYRIGYHFRESIVDEVRERVGETVISKAMVPIGFCEPIPKTQEEISDQADKALRDLFPRIPNTDRQVIIDHAFKLGATFHGEPTVGLQANIPLSRRVQLATLAHIRHTHTRYDKLLRETSWINARKVVEPICLDVLLKWRGDEETGRDQLEEILREVVVITDSDSDDAEDSEESSDGDDSLDDESEATSSNSTGESDGSDTVDPPARRSTLPTRPRAQEVASVPFPQETVQRTGQDRVPPGPIRASVEEVASPAIPMATNDLSPKHASNRWLKKQDKLAQKGFHRYRHALADALQRRDDNRVSTNDQLTRAGQILDSPHYNGNGESQRHDDVRHSKYVGRNAQLSERLTSSPLRINSAQYRGEERPNTNMVRQPNEDAARPRYAQRPPQYYTPEDYAPDGREHVLRDFLVPSIEAAPQETFHLRRAEQGSSQREREHGQFSFSGANHRQSLPHHQIIVLDDESPRAKRPRFDRESSVGQARIRASPVRTSFVSFDSAHAMISRPEDLRPHPAVDTTAAANDIRSYYVGPTTREQLPVYDASTGRLISMRSQDRRASEFVDMSLHPDRMSNNLVDQNIVFLRRDQVGNLHPSDDRPRRVFENVRDFRGYSQAVEPRRAGSPPYLRSKYAPQQPGRGAVPLAEHSGVVNQQLVPTFSQSHLGSDVVQRGDGVIIIREDGRAPDQALHGHRDDRRYHFNDERRRMVYEEPAQYRVETG